MYSDECTEWISQKDVEFFTDWHTDYMRRATEFRNLCRRAGAPEAFIANCDLLFGTRIDYGVNIRKIHAKHILCEECAYDEEEDFDQVVDYVRFERMTAKELCDAEAIEEAWELNRHFYFDMFVEERGYGQLAEPFRNVIQVLNALDEWADHIQDKYMACVVCGERGKEK